MASINFDTANTGYGGNYGGYPGYGGYKDYHKETCYPVVIPHGNNGYCNDRDNDWTDLAALALVTGDGFGRRYNDDGRCYEKMIDMHDHHDDHNHEVDEIHKVQMEVCAAERQIGEGFADTARDTLEAKYALSGDIKDCCCELERDILGTKFDLSTQILTNRYENALQGKDLTREIDLQSCGINRNIDEVKFNQALFAKDAQAQLAACCCELEKQIAQSISVTEKTAADTQMLIIKTDAKNDLKDAERENRALQREIDELRFDKKFRDSRDEQNVLNNFGIINDSLNKVITALGNTAA